MKGTRKEEGELISLQSYTNFVSSLADFDETMYKTFLLLP
jgi:hypothetical protein